MEKKKKKKKVELKTPISQCYHQNDIAMVEVSVHKNR
jgi:hypothetical protein